MNNMSRPEAANKRLWFRFLEVSQMLKAIDVAKYFFAKDPNREIFNSDMIERNGRFFCEGRG